MATAEADRDVVYPRLTEELPAKLKQAATTMDATRRNAQKASELPTFQLYGEYYYAGRGCRSEPR